MDGERKNTMAKVKVIDIKTNTMFNVVIAESLQAGMSFNEGAMVIELKVGSSKIITKTLDASIHNMKAWDELEARVFEDLNTMIVFTYDKMFVSPQLQTMKEIYAMLTEFKKAEDEDDDRTK